MIKNKNFVIFYAPPGNSRGDYEEINIRNDNSKDKRVDINSDRESELFGDHGTMIKEVEKHRANDELRQSKENVSYSHISDSDIEPDIGLLNRMFKRLIKILSKPFVFIGNMFSANSRDYIDDSYTTEKPEMQENDLYQSSDDLRHDKSRSSSFAYKEHQNLDPLNRELNKDKEALDQHIFQEYKDSSDLYAIVDKSKKQSVEEPKYATVDKSRKQSVEELKYVTVDKSRNRGQVSNSDPSLNYATMDFSQNSNTSGIVRGEDSTNYAHVTVSGNGKMYDINSDKKDYHVKPASAEQQKLHVEAIRKLRMKEAAENNIYENFSPRDSFATSEKQRREDDRGKNNALKR